MSTKSADANGACFEGAANGEPWNPDGTLELPGKNPLKDAHAALDAAVLSAYGFDPQADLLRQLLELNLEVATRIDAGQAVTAPGVPPAYPEPAALVTTDCIQPPPIT